MWLYSRKESSNLIDYFQRTEAYTFINYFYLLIKDLFYNITKQYSDLLLLISLLHTFIFKLFILYWGIAD